MKKLLLLRHAKAGQNIKSITDDHERALTDKGVAQCKNVAASLRESGNTHIDLVLCSPALRTRQTLEHVQSHLGHNYPAEYPSKLYLGSAEDILREIFMVSDSIGTLMLVGHNPGLHQCVLSLVARGSKIRDLASNFPPASLAIMEVPIDQWSQIHWRTATLENFFNPKLHLEPSLQESS